MPVSASRALVAVCLASLATGGLASTAMAKMSAKEEFAPFADCPLETAALCPYATTTSGQLTIGHKTVPITKTIVLQGGLPPVTGGYFEERPLLAAADGNTLSKTPLEVPGGLVGIAGLGGEVTATAEIAGPVSGVKVSRGNLIGEQGTAITLPLKVKLSNPTLGEACYVGTDAEPIVLHLTTGTTNPPPPNN